MSLPSPPPGLAWVLHRLEGFGRSYRWWLNPAAFRRYRTLLARAPARPSGTRPVVVFDFKDSRIDGPQGRRFYTLFMYFVRAGYEPAFTRSYPFLATIGSRMKRLCLEEKYSILGPGMEFPDGCVVVTDRTRAPRPGGRVRKTISIDYRPEYARDREGFPMPFPMFPGVYAQGADLGVGGLRSSPRPWRLFFGGDARPEKYTKSSTPTVYRKVPRSRVLEILREHLGPALWIAPETREEMDRMVSRRWDGLLVMNTRKVKVPPRDWLPMLARASFFVACPGVRYPMSHNVIEALAVGTVPLLEYPDHFHPALEEGVNCLVYDGEDGLRRAADRAMAMSLEEMRRLSEGAAAYYDRHLEPGAVVRKLLDTPGPEVRLRLLPFLERGGGYA